LVLEAGRGAVYIKSTRKPGEIILNASSYYVEEKATVNIKTKKIDFPYV
jgi:beta-galactosidase